MPSLRSSVLIIGHPEPDIHATGADFAVETDVIKQMLDQGRYSVIAFNSKGNDSLSFDELSSEIQTLQPSAQKILINFGLSFETLQKATETLGLFRVLNNYDEPYFQQTLQEALEEHSFRAQDEQLINLINEQNERLKKLSIDLEKRVEKRQKYLINARQKLLTSNERIETLHKALTAIHHASSVSDLEMAVNEALKSTMSLSWTRIFFEWQNVLSKHNAMSHGAFEIFSAPILRGKELVGQIYFARNKSNPFRKDEHNFLLQVADAVALAIDRLYRFEETQTLKQQWEATFDAITTPVSLINKDYEIVRCNKAFADKTGSPITRLIGKKCYQSLFGRNRPCDLCHLGSSFRLTPQRTKSGESITFEVATQQLEDDSQDSQLFVTMYRDISEQLKLQRHVLESSKMAEIGTIGSSIAHELNNPLGGMISFLQLIKADLTGTESFFEDIVEMEKGAVSCKEIVQNLLNFSRLPSVDNQEKIDFKMVIDRAIKITELQTKSKGIEIHCLLPEEGVIIDGQFHLLTQAIRHLLQFSISTISEQMKNSMDFIGKINISINFENEVFIFYIETNTAYPHKHLHDQNFHSGQSLESASFGPGLDLSITDQIIVEHSGTLEIISQLDNSFLVKVTLPRPTT